MENKTENKNTIIKFGLLTAAVSIILTLISYATGNVAKPGTIMTILGFVAPIVIIILGIKNFKSINGGYLKWGEAVKVGVGITLIWGVLALGFQYVLENFIDPTILEQKTEIAREALEKWGLNEDVIEESLEKQQNQNPLLANAMGLLTFAFIGFVVSAITGAIMKKTKENDY